MPFIDYKKLPADQRCTSSEHDPPGMLVLQPGQYTYQCPACGQTVTFTVSPRMCEVASKKLGGPWVPTLPSPPPWEWPYKEDMIERRWGSTTSCDTYGEPEFPTPRPTQSQSSYWHRVE